MKFLTERELCELLKVKRVFVYNCRKQGMPCVRLGVKLIRYNLDEVLRWLNERAKDGESA